MRISYNSRVFVAESSFEEKDAVKAAGFRWHPAAGKCDGPAKCWGCKSGAPHKTWWTADAGAAARLAQYADASARPLIEAHQQALTASRAADAGVELPCPEGLAYLPYQRAGIAYALAKSRVLFGDVPGLGKTIESLGVLNTDESLCRVLVLCPASVKINWQREAQKWLIRPYTIVRVNAFGDLVQVPAEGRVLVITNPDRLVGKYGAPIAAALRSMPWDALIADEVHGYCNPEAQRSVILYGAPAKRAKGDKPATPAIPGLIDKTRRFIALTGTPIPNRPFEMFGLLHALAPDAFPSSFTFGKRYCGGRQEMVPQRGGGRRPVWKFDGASHLDELQDKLRATCMVRRLKEDVLKELPPKRRSLVVLENEQIDPEWQDDAFDDFLDGRDGRFRTQIARLEADVEMAEASGDGDAYAAAVRSLDEAASVAFTAMSEERHRIGLAKLPQVIEHVRTVLDGGQGKLILFAHHHDVIDRLVADLADYGVVSLTGATPQDERQKAVDAFMNPRIRVFVGQIDAAGVGLTLTASSHVIFAEWSWSPSRLAQAEDRAHRIGQANAVLVEYLILEGTIEARMAQVVLGKRMVAFAALDAVAAPIIAVTDRSATATHSHGAPRPQLSPKTWPVATPEERRAAAIAMQLLAGVCDGARKRDGAGFSAMDVHCGHGLAERSLARALTDGEVALAKKLARKYKKQLAGAGVLETLGVAA